MTQRFCAAVALNDNGVPFPSFSVFDNYSLEIFTLDLEAAPRYIRERLAMLKMTDPTGGATLGNKVNEQYIHIYLTQTEFNQLKRVHSK